MPRGDQELRLPASDARLTVNLPPAELPKTGPNSGLRWLEIAHGLRFDLSRSMVPQLRLALLDADADEGRCDA